MTILSQKSVSLKDALLKRYLISQWLRVGKQMHSALDTETIFVVHIELQMKEQANHISVYKQLHRITNHNSICKY